MSLKRKGRRIKPRPKKEVKPSNHVRTIARCPECHARLKPGATACEYCASEFELNGVVVTDVDDDAIEILGIGVVRERTDSEDPTLELLKPEPQTTIQEDTELMFVYLVQYFSEETLGEMTVKDIDAQISEAWGKAHLSREVYDNGVYRKEVAKEVHRVLQLMYGTVSAVHDEMFARPFSESRQQLSLWPLIVITLVTVVAMSYAGFIGAWPVIVMFLVIGMALGVLAIVGEEV